MADLAPIYQLSFFIRQKIISGRSLSSALNDYVDQHAGDQSDHLRMLLINFKACRGIPKDFGAPLSSLREVIYQLLWEGLSGQPILDQLNRLEPEILSACEREADAFVRSLPLRVTIVIMSLSVPALILLFFGLFFQVFLAKGFS